MQIFRISRREKKKEGKCNKLENNNILQKKKKNRETKHIYWYIASLMQVEKKKK